MDAGDLLEVLIHAGVHVVLSGPQARARTSGAWRTCTSPTPAPCRPCGCAGTPSPATTCSSSTAAEVKIHRRFPFGESHVMTHFSLAGDQFHREHELPDPGTNRPGRRVADHARQAPTDLAATLRRKEATTTMRTVVLVDGEHYPPVTRWAIDDRDRDAGHDVVGAAVRRRHREDRAGVAARPRGADARRRRRSHGRRSPTAIDALDARGRARPRPTSRCSATASGWSWRRSPSTRGVPYVGRRLPARAARPRRRRRRCPTLAVIGTGKRTGKTAISGEVARLAARRGLDPGGRGDGAGRPRRAPGRRGRLGRPRRLVRARSAPGEHAASDYLEDALTTGVTTIGARRAGGGLAGAAVRDERAARRRRWPPTRDPGLLVLEGSGVGRAAGALGCGGPRGPGDAPRPSTWGAISGPYRLLRSDLAVVTMAAGPILGPRTSPHCAPTSCVSWMTRGC